MIGGQITSGLDAREICISSWVLINRIRDLRIICFLFVFLEEFVTKMSFRTKDFSFLSRSAFIFPVSLYLLGSVHMLIAPLDPFPLILKLISF
jgi:hypothetical protein